MVGMARCAVPARKAGGTYRMWMTSGHGLKARDVIARPGGPGKCPKYILFDL